ncbi:MAG: MoxR family ATPase [Bacteroidota bacterium]
MEDTNIQFKLTDIPSVKHLKAQYNNSQTYILSKEIDSAVTAAIRLGQPLFITGEPGTGKTQLAYKVAQHFGLKDEQGEIRPLIFNTKTTSTAKDLFYMYDAVRHFRDANRKDGAQHEMMEYIELQALGKAIAYTNPADAAKVGIQLDAPRHSVVLIDEIDKAPTDFPNDILYELENMAFEIKETGEKIKAGEDCRPIVIMTSNSEKSLPDAFLRRCVFLHIEFPKKDLLIDIVRSKLSPDLSTKTDENGAEVEKANERLEVLVQHFEEIRDAVKKKRPATAELIGWIRVLEMEKFLEKNKIDFSNLTKEQEIVLGQSYGILAKNNDDLEILKKKYLKQTYQPKGKK